MSLPCLCCWSPWSDGWPWRYTSCLRKLLVLWVATKWCHIPGGMYIINLTSQTWILHVSMQSPPGPGKHHGKKNNLHFPHWCILIFLFNQNSPLPPFLLPLLPPSPFSLSLSTIPYSLSASFCFLPVDQFWFPETLRGGDRLTPPCCNNVSAVISLCKYREEFHPARYVVP